MTLGLRTASHVPGKIGFITDCEGNYAYWEASVALSDVVGFDPEGELVFIRDSESDGFVFGGDVFDKGPGRIWFPLPRVRCVVLWRLFRFLINQLKFAAKEFGPSMIHLKTTIAPLEKGILVFQI